MNINYLRPFISFTILLILSTNGALAETVSRQLAEIYRQDQSDRQGMLKPGQDKKNNWFKNVDWKKLKANDSCRRKRVIEFLKENKLKSKNDYYHAAMIMQHGNSTKDYMLAHILSTSAALKGHKKAVWLSAASFDRLMQSTDEPQVFGTQFYQEQNKNLEIKKPRELDLITDSIRKLYNVPDLSESKKFVEKNDF